MLYLSLALAFAESHRSMAARGQWLLMRTVVVEVSGCRDSVACWDHRGCRKENHCWGRWLPSLGGLWGLLRPVGDKNSGRIAVAAQDSGYFGQYCLGLMVAEAETSQLAPLAKSSTIAKSAPKQSPLKVALKVARHSRPWLLRLVVLSSAWIYFRGLHQLQFHKTFLANLSYT